MRELYRVKMPHTARHTISLICWSFCWYFHNLCYLSIGKTEPRVRVQALLVPLQTPPLQPAKTLPVVALAVRVTTELVPRPTVQVPVVELAARAQLMPPEVTLPAPLPVAVTLSAEVAKAGPPRTRRT